MRKFTLLALSLLVFVGLSAQNYDAETLAKMHAEKQAAEVLEMQTPKVQTHPNVSKEDILMQTGTVTTCDGMFYDTGGADGEYQSDADLTLTLLPETDGAQIMVTFTMMDIENNYDYLYVYNGSSTDGELLAELTGSTMPTEPFIGSNAEGALTFHFTSDGSVTKPGWTATVECFTLVGNNLAATGIQGAPFATANTEKTFGISVKNMGTETVVGADYDIQLLDVDENVLGTAAGVDLASNEEATIDVAWTPTAAGIVTVHGYVNFTADENMANNATGTIEVEVMAEGTHVAQVGTDETFPPSRVPFDFYYKNSASQTIYTPDQLGISGGAILSIAYENNFATDLSAGKSVKIWIGETTQADLSEGWVDPSTLTPVYDGVIELPAGQNVIPIQLNEPYIYGGGNLVIYTYRVWEDEYFSSSDKFYGTEIAESNCTRRASSDTEFDSSLEGTDGAAISWTPNTTIFFSTEGLGALEGNVTSGGDAVEGVKVQIVDAFSSTMTDANGDYGFPYLLEGMYNLELSKHGYENTLVNDVEVIGDETVVADATIDPIPTYSVSGTVIASDTEMGVEGAEILFEGYDTYTSTTGVNGEFTIEGVYGSGRDYYVTVDYEGYSTYTTTVTVNDVDVVGLEFIVEEIAYPVVNLTAEVVNDAAELSWTEPGTLVPVEFLYDNGVQTGQLGSSTGTDNTVLGSVHRVNAQLQEVSWYTTAEGGPHSTVNVFIFDLDESGQPTSTVLYSAMAVENLDNEWNTLTLEEAIDAPNGFMVGVSYAGFLGIGTTTPDDDFPFIENTQYFSGDYTGGEFAAVETLGDPTLNNNFMVRAYGYDMGKTTAPSFAYGKARSTQSDLELISNEPVQTDAPVYTFNGNTEKALIDYTVYRFAEGTEMVDWTELATAVTETTYTDATWTDLDFGLYQYAVVANYTNDVTSDARLTNVLEKDMTVPFTVSITTNATDDATGALVTLTNQDGDAEHVYTMTADADGAAFDAVWRGTYDITITLDGFESHVATDIDITTEGGSYEIELIEIIMDPFGLMVSQDGDAANFSWNNAMGFTDDFESYEDFIFENIGDYTQVDQDGSATYAITDVTFPNQEYVGSYIIFNPSTATPALDAAWLPYSGDKYLACFAAQTPANDDWIITPEVTAANGMAFSFMGKSITDQYGLERFNVAVSTTGTAPADFTVISGSSFIEAPIEWTEFSYDLSAYAGQNIYIAIQCVSNDAFVFMVDDLTVGVAKTKAFNGYTVYLDGNEEASGVTETNYTFEGLGIGTYTAGVKAVYDSGESEIMEIEFGVLPEVTFVVKDEADNLMEGATVTMEGADYTTDINGEATMMMEVGSYDYTVVMDGYYEATGTIDVTSTPVITEQVVLVEMVYTATLNVTDDANGDALEGVAIEISLDGEVIETLTTDVDGSASVDLSNGAYDFVATLAGYGTIEESFTIGGANETINFTMVGMDDFAKAQLSIYPNPSNGNFNITVDGEYEVTVVNSVGQVVHSEVIVNNSEIDLGNVVSGLYIVTVKSNDKFATQSIVIE
jgi:hypothetical protein